ncbi:putative holin-like toxin [Staphylococcus parequorum]
METPCVVSIVEALHLMLGFGMFIVTLLGLVITIVKLSYKK